MVNATQMASFFWKYSELLVLKISYKAKIFVLKRDFLL